MRSHLLLSAVAALAITSANAADLASGKGVPAAPVVSPWDYAIGGGATTNYLFRGISQSDNKPSVNANAEIRYTFSDMFTGYVGAAASSIKLTNQAQSPGVEIDAIAGVRATIGSFGVDVGAIAYIYPSFTTFGNAVFPTNPTYYEGYVKTSYAVNDNISLGLNGYFSPSFLDTGASGQYVSGTFAWKLPNDFALSGELGYQFLGTADFTHGGANLPDYAYWNLGASYTYKIATLDLRYHDTNLSKAKCAIITGETSPGTSASKYCNAAFVATLSFSLQAKDIK
jgi:uncharacterized protein (TIGR02001 family)